MDGTDAYPVNKIAFDAIAVREIEEGSIVVSGSSRSYKAGSEYYKTYGEEANRARYDLTPEKAEEIKKELEDAAQYFSDTKKVEDIIPIIQNLVQLYLQEHR